MKEQQGSLLVVTTQKALTSEQCEAMKSAINPLVESMGMKAVVLQEGMEVGLHMDIRPLIEQQIEEQRKTNQLLMLLVETLAEEVDMDTQEPGVYLDGTPTSNA